MYAQFGEDAWILSQFPAGYKGTAIEVGAFDGRHISNTLALEERGWDVLCIEPNPDAFDKCRQIRKLCRRLACGAKPAYNQLLHVNNIPDRYTTLDPSYSAGLDLGCEPAAFQHTVAVDVETLDNLIKHYNFQPLDVLSIDTEGTEAEVLAGLTCINPRIVIAESWLPHGKVCEMLHERGYTLIKHVSHNYWFIRENKP